jgi:hypothetical protein
MDNQKPHNLWQLWKDNRDTLSYYTIWGVIIFGGVTAFLAFLSLAISISQTIAAYRALHLATPTPLSG